MILFLKLLLAHLLGDFVFQFIEWIADKEKKKIKSLKLYFHIIIHGILLLIAVNLDIKKYGLGIFVILITHFLIDLLKLYFQKKNTKRIWFFIDQFLHISILLLSVYFWGELPILYQNIALKKVILLSIALLLVTKVASVTIKTVIMQWKPEGKNTNDNSLVKAGNFIGVLERLFVFTFIVFNQWQAIGFLLAAKSVFRFGDLSKSKERKLTEYILIGTLLSFGIAILTGIVYLKLLKNI